MRNFALILVIFSVFSGCTGENGSGTLEFTLYGEDFIEQGIPAAASSEDEGLVDGWSVQFSKFFICIGNLKVEDHSGVVGAEDSAFYIFDVHQPGPHTFATFTEVDAQRWEHVSFTIRRADSSALSGNVSNDDVDFMAQNNYSVYVEGTASNGTDTYSFTWGFDTETDYGDCHHDDFGDGVLVPNGGVESAEITIHGDHLFYDDLQSSDTVLRFNAIQIADSNTDFDITLEELAGVDLTTLTEGTYGTGGVGTVEDLGAFIRALTQTLGHYRGEGHCHASSL